MERPYPVAIVPLLPQFLIRRRTKLDFPLRAMDELGIDRPAFFFALQLEWIGDGASLGDWSPYATHHDALLPASAAARGAGLVDERDGRWYLTEKGRGYAQRTRSAAHEHLARLETIPPADLEQLASLLEGAFRSQLAANEPTERTRTQRASRFRADIAPAHPLVSLENAVYSLWMFRDDCHIAAWRSAGFEGPELDALTRIWRNEADSIDALAALLSAQRRDDVEAAVARLRRDGLVAGDTLAVTDRGRAERQAIEDETDRLYFTPWPERLRDDAGWMTERLEAVNAALA